MKFPDFIVIGAMKAGTTSLYEYLKKHPDIYMATPKELDYFMTSKNYNKGDVWYKNHFNTNKIAGEVSPNYSKYEITANLIHEKIPDCKFIYITRNPVERTLSQINHMEIDINVLRRTNNWDNFEFIQTSKYYLQISRYLKHFDIEQFLFITSDELKQKPLETMNKIFSFLNVRKLNSKDLFKTIHHKTEEKVSYTKIGTLVKSNLNLIKSIVPNSFYIKLKKIKIISKLFFKKKKMQHLDNELRNKLYYYYEDDLKKFLKITGLKTNWLKN